MSGFEAGNAGDKQAWYMQPRPVLALCFSRSFVLVSVFSQVEFLSEISLFLPLPI